MHIVGASGSNCHAPGTGFEVAAKGTTMAEPRTGKARSGEVEIFYRLFGEPGGVPAVIVHGLSYFSYDWIEPAAALARGRQVAAMDMRGFGESGWAKDYSVPAFAGDIVAVIDHLGWAKAVLIGHSMGGRNCVYCAATHGDRVAGLVLVDWAPENAPAGSRRVAETVGRLPERFATIDEAMRYFIEPRPREDARRRARFEAYLAPVPGGFAIKRDPYFREQFRRVLETGERPKPGVDLWTTLAKVSCPVLMLRGKRSDMVAAETVSKMKAVNPRMALAELDSGHDVAGDDPAGFLREVGAFLDQQ